jgi:aspartyl-tRNA(Asn)/glutamyl-tRNA(Gln) amidotransferase subunit A
VSDEVVFLPLAEQAHRIATRALSARELVQAHLGRIEALDRKLRAYITVCADRALAEAARADAAVAAGAELPPLHGVPIALKDLVDLAGVPTTAGSRILADRVPDEDAPVTAHLRAAGAIVLGKLNMHEFAYGPEGLNPHHGDAWNPWDPRTHRIAGGSSSGSAVAVAMGLCAGALGSDTGGSIRLPAALCGITGLKPTYGRVSRDGVVPLAWSLDHVGPMTRSARDAALMLDAMVDEDPAPDFAAALSGKVRGLRVGLLRPFFLDGALPAVRAAVEAAARVLEEQGARVTETALPDVQHANAASLAIIWPEALAFHDRWLRERPGDYDPRVRDRLRLGAFVGAVEHVHAQRVRDRLRRAASALLERFDVLLAPSAPIVASPLDQHEVVIDGVRGDRRSALIRFTQPFNLTGHPAASVPCGLDPDGLPIGLQIVGRAWDEATVLRVADAYQRATDWHQRRPPTAGA